MTPPENTPQKILERASAIIITLGWVQNNIAVDKAGDEVEPENPSAERFCAMGAVCRACHELGGKNYNAAMLLLERYVGSLKTPTDWNDAPKMTADKVAAGLLLASVGGGK